MELPEGLVEKAAKELNETPETRAAGLQALHEHYAAHPDQRPHRTDDPYLLTFLRHAKFDVPRARARIATLERWLHECRQELGDVSKLRGEMFRELYGQRFLGLLGDQRRTRDGALISLLIPRNMEPLADPSLLLKWNMWTLMRGVRDPYIQVCGQVVLESFAAYSLLHTLRFRQVPTATMKKNFHFAQECMPFRVKGIWLLHPPKWIGLLYAIARPFMSKKLRSRIRVFGGSEQQARAQLHELVDPRVLPAEFGGTHADAGEAWFEAELRREAEEDAAAAAAVAAGARAAVPLAAEP